MNDSEKILAIDTSSPICTVALMCEGKMIIRQTQAARQAALSLLPMVEDLLKESKLSLNELDAIAVASGPGSFTGLRIGIGVVQGLSTAAKLPVVALSNLAVASFAAIRHFPSGAALACFHAREQEMYFAAYIADAELGVVVVGAEQVATIAELDFELRVAANHEPWVAVGDGWSEKIALESQFGVSVAQLTLENELDMESLCVLATLNLRAGNSKTPQDVQPNYIKEQLDY